LEKGPHDFSWERFNRFSEDLRSRGFKLGLTEKTAHQTARSFHKKIAKLKESLT